MESVCTLKIHLIQCQCTRKINFRATSLVLDLFFFFFHISLTCNAGINCALSVEFQKPQCDVSQILDVKFTQRRCCLVDTINFYVVSGTDIHDHAIVVITM